MGSTHEIFKAEFDALIQEEQLLYRLELEHHGKFEIAEFVRNVVKKGSGPVSVLDSYGNTIKRQPDWSYGRGYNKTTNWVGLIACSQSLEDAVEQAEQYLATDTVKKVIIVDLPYQGKEPHWLVGGDVRLRILGRSCIDNSVVTLFDKVRFLSIYIATFSL